ncbi:hypothetical protein [Dactylosporangium salmoneum]|uniref:Uncharacterized protein n=1 Tax=Dactylosporangium salmoneum TaxID=53361 RepID=A0ABN3GAD3_9ACTN
MTQTTTAAKIYEIPAEGLTAQVGDVTVKAFWVNGAGFKVEARRGRDLIASSLHTFDTHAIPVYEALVAEHTPAPVEPAPAAEVIPAAPVVRLAAAAKGTATKVTDPQHTALVIALMNGRVERGGKEGQFNVRVLTALAKRGYLDLTYQAGRRDARKVVTGGTITPAGRTRLDQLTAAERQAAERAARLATALTINLAA